MSSVQQTEIHPLTKRVNELFKEFSAQIPRRSSNEKAAADYVADFAEALKNKGTVSEVIRQYENPTGKREIHNVIVKKPATPDRADSAPIILQAHMDMVCEPKTGTEHNFDTDPIVFYESEEDGVTWLRATLKDGGSKVKTTLGADDGIGVACILAILESENISHPPIEAVFTSDEEAEMSGAENIAKEHLTAKRMINIDTEQEGVFFNGCAGGLNVTSNIPLELVPLKRDISCYTLSVTGLLGGHSGLMIAERRANANRLMGRALDKLQEKFDNRIYVSDIKGGEYPNAIPNSCTAQIAVDKGLEDELATVVNELSETFKTEYKGTDASPEIYENDDRNKGLHLNLDETGISNALFMTTDTLDKVITLLATLPNGVIDMHTEYPKSDGDDLVETSSNMGMVYVESTESGNPVLKVVCFARSCFESKKHMVERQIKRIARYVGADVNTSSDFPAWAPDSGSAIRRVLENIYNDEFKDLEKIAQTKSIHAGLECGYFARAIPGLDCIAIGPTILGAHTIDERLQIDTVNLIVRLLVRAMKDIDNDVYSHESNVMAITKHKHKAHLNCMCMR